MCLTWCHTEIFFWAQLIHFFLLPNISAFVSYISNASLCSWICSDMKNKEIDIIACIHYRTNKQFEKSWVCLFLEGCVGGNGIKLSRIICYYQAPVDEKDLGVILPIFPESCLAVICSWMCSSISLSRNSQSNFSFAKLSTPFFVSLNRITLLAI